MKTFLICLWLCLPGLLYAQVEDSFDDNDFHHNPAWVGMDSLFLVNIQKQLQSNGKAGITSSYLATPFFQFTDLEWSCWFRMAFNPSTQNQARWFLFSDSMNLTQCRNGVYVQMGGSTGTTDSISLYQLKEGMAIPLIRGRPATLGKTNNIFHVRVTFIQNTWCLYTDTSAQLTFPQVEGCFKDTVDILSQSYQGFVFRYTQSNATNFYADNYYQGNIIRDSTPPKLNDYHWISNDSLLLTFSEPISVGSISTSNNLIKTQSLFNKQLLAVFHQPVDLFTEIGIQLYNVRDLVGNQMADTLLKVMIVIPQKEQLIITEYMYDPTPAIGLPDAEFIEIYNHSPYPFKLNEILLCKRGACVALSTNYETINPKEFLLLISPSDSIYFKHILNKSFALLPNLANAGDTIWLQNKQGVKLHEISYKGKEPGGKSMEMIHPERLCLGSQNWVASMNTLGGTPGEQNSLWHWGKDTTPFIPISIEFLDSMNIKIHLNKSPDTLRYKVIDIMVNSRKNIGILGINNIEIKLTEPLLHRNPVRISIDSVEDCSGNKLKIDTTLIYYEVSRPRIFELLITEIKFLDDPGNSLPPAEYIELYNNSNFALSLNNFRIKNGNEECTLKEAILRPNEYLIVCSDKFVEEFAVFGKTMGLTNFPTLANSDKIEVQNQVGAVLHFVQYEYDWFYDRLFTLPKALSLELANILNPCGGSEVWLPALGSPGKINQQKSQQADNKKPLLQMNCFKDERLILTFNEAVDSSKFIVNPSDGIQVGYCGDHRKQLVINFENEKLPELLTIEAFTDCAGNKNQQQGIELRVAQPANTGDIIISELLFNSHELTGDFIELYNASEEPINLEGLLLARSNYLNEPWQEVIALDEEGICLNPKQSLALTPNVTTMLHFYPLSKEEGLFNYQTLQLPIDGNYVQLLDSNLKVIDSAYYEESFHHSLLALSKGISIERRYAGVSGLLKEAWQTNSFEATPGTHVHVASTHTSSPKLTIEPRVFSPNLDGFEDEVNFYIPIENTTWVKLSIVNLHGEVIWQEAAKLYRSSHGPLRWQGQTQSRQAAQEGYYIVCLEVASEEGSVKQFRGCFALSVE